MLLSEMIVINLPSPATLQWYCVETLYEHLMNDESAISCDPKGPLILYISDDDYGFGLVFPDCLALHVCFVCLY